MQWIRAHGYKTVILVTNNYHMPRSLAEIRRLDRDTEFLPYPVEKRLTVSDIAANPLMLRAWAPNISNICWSSAAITPASRSEHIRLCIPRASAKECGSSASGTFP